MLLLWTALLSLLLELEAARPRNSWDLGSSTRCVPIPPGMVLCQDIGYTEMRLPNLLEHDTLGEVTQQAASWLPLLARECHPHARIFLCSLFAPICLDRLIYPCRSLCEAVRSSCAPIMACYGYPWPEILNCNKFPAEHLMCISSISNQTSSNRHVIPRASCRDCELREAASVKEILDTFCSNDFAVKIRISKSNFSSPSISQFNMDARIDVLKHGPLLRGEIRPKLQRWLDLDITCVQNLMRMAQSGVYIIAGKVQGDRLVVNKAYSWHRRDKNLMAATRKWKQHRCRSQ
ncbi:secreted frizzled-related protein 5 [Erpetoichthys calabaricus]|uniref:Secreted frizzled-related protein 1 n=1 Tax=Erpetoichthys calabaricus TaxID=27687 RepID=A0A8C4THU7_ERPCA|nr:secreted frizzled-related protein 5 [Erpetoichthys calabaricus]